MNWDGFSYESLHECTVHLIVAVAVPEPDKAMWFFHWLNRHPIATPTFAILPSEPDEVLLRTASEAVDDFILWPVRVEEWRHRLARILGPEGHDVASIRSRLTREMGLAQLVGNTGAFVRTIEKIPLIAQSDAPVLITGETGTGKELCARAIHHLSKRRNFPLIPVECGALPDHLFENELFGHARGAFTDAKSDQKGLVAMAEGGTLVLDEIDTLSLTAQAKLLRFLEEHTYRPLGAVRFTHVNVRVIAATNRDLESCLREKQFRSDLYFRLNVLRLHLPALRDRCGDATLLARHFLESLCGVSGSPRKSFSPSALGKLEGYNWPGNVRELFNVVQAAFVFSKGTQIFPCHLSLPSSDAARETPQRTFREAKTQIIEAFERAYVEELLARHHGNVTRAAAEAGKDRRAFGRLAKKYDIPRRAGDLPR